MMSHEPAAPSVAIPKLLDGQKAIVTGGGSGIGKGIALALGEAGADVLVNFACRTLLPFSGGRERERSDRRARPLQRRVGRLSFTVWLRDRAQG
jgi:NAD(P)-dependent dehydrogenase (short-subunit alcohol dehydrogenase family)